MSAKINDQYVKEYAAKFTGKICDDYYSNIKYMSGQAIVQLSPVPQVNFFIIKTLFEAWQLELEKLKSNPYFDYRDNTVHQALNEFMNVLSRTIKIKRKDFEPLVQHAVAETILLALDPIAYFEKEFDKYEANELNAYLKDNKKYFKWHVGLIDNLIDKAGLSRTHIAYKSNLKQNFVKLEAELEPGEKLLSSFDSFMPLDFQLLTQKASQDKIFTEEKEKAEKDFEEVLEKQNQSLDMDEIPTAPQEVNPILVEHDGPSKPAISGKSIDPLYVWDKFEAEGYSIMKGTVKNLVESVGINQRIMFTKALFDGNSDLFQNALQAIDSLNNFSDSVKLLNERFVDELKWDVNSEVVNEFLQLVYRKFDVKG